MEDKIEPGEGIVAFCERMRREETPYVLHQPTAKEWSDLWKHIKEESRKPRVYTHYMNGAVLKEINPEKYKNCDDHCTYIITYTNDDFPF